MNMYLLVYKIVDTKQMFSFYFISKLFLDHKLVLNITVVVFGDYSKFSESKCRVTPNSLLYKNVLSH